MRRLLLYVHFNKFNAISPHVLYQLEKINPIFSKIVFLSNSQLPQADIDHLFERGLIHEFMQRDNIGFDFAAWRDGMELIGFNHLQDYDSVTLMNDTCFGPLWDLQEHYNHFEQKSDTDFWGMTNHRAVKNTLKEHIQSYFISFKKSILESEVFQGFWQGIQNHTEVQLVIDQYETQMTDIFRKAGFSYDTVLNVNLQNKKEFPNENFSQIYPSKILKERVPFLKIKAIDANPVDAKHIVTPFILQEVENASDYPVQLIVDHMSKINRPDFEYLLNRKYLPLTKFEETTKKIAVHLHVFFEELIDEFFEAFQSFHFNYDLFITTDRLEKVPVIEERLLAYQLTGQIVVTGNVGRDVLPMLKLKDQLADYDYIGHFHTKKSTLAVDYLIGQSWRRELIDMLVRPADAIIANFDQKADLGIVISDIPTAFRYHNMISLAEEQRIAPHMNELWSKMQMNKSINFSDFKTFVMSYGTFVWFKYDALEKVFELNLQDKDVPEEPLPQDSILHVIERLLIYIAWDKNYDFYISKNPTDIPGFVDNRELNGREGHLATVGRTYVDFNQMGGIKGALKYIVLGPARAIKYIIIRLKHKIEGEK
ncbi:rhamnan synthesis F family protein [Streptococcus cameli]